MIIGMVDTLKARLDKLRRVSESAKRRASLYTDIAKIDHKHASPSLRALEKAPAPGKKLQKVGFILFWIPEPTCVTMAIGAPMILAGRYMEKKYNSATIHDIGHETKNHIATLSDFKNSVM